MEILYLLIPLAMVLLVIIAGFFFWSVKSGQMDDLEGPAYRILMDDDTVQKKTQAKTDPNPEVQAEQSPGKENNT